VKHIRTAWQDLARGELVAGPAIGVGVIVTVVALIVGSKRGDVRVDIAMASMAAFLFGVLLAFTIVRTRERLVLVQDLVAKSDATLLTIHDAVAVFGDRERDEIRDLIDLHLTDQIDYRLVDYHRAAPSFRALIKSVLGLRPRNPEQDAVYKELVARCFVLDNDRALIEAASGQAMSPLEWTGLLLLLAVLLGLLAVLPGGTPLGSLVAGVMAGALVTLIVLLRKLDLLRWHERVTIWEPTTRLFRSMGRDPYVPREVIDSGRYRPAGRVRVVDYPDPYPLRANKVVTIADEVDTGPITSVDRDTPDGDTSPTENYLGIHDTTGRNPTATPTTGDP
jgi:hypothetical protein